MKQKTSFWQRIGLHDWFLKKDAPSGAARQPALTPNELYHYIISKFQDSVQQLSFANRIVFYHEYIISFNSEDYRDFQENKKGIFGLIVQESVRQFYEILDRYRKEGKTVVPSASKWVFRFASHPDYARGDKGFIGRLLPGSSPKKDENLRVTFIPRQTGIATTYDVNEEMLGGFTFYSEGYYELPFRENAQDARPNTTASSSFGRLETILPDKAYAGKKLEYLIRKDDFLVSGSDEPEGGPDVFRIPSEWVNSPHLRIRYNSGEGRFYLASFGEKTVLNEKELGSSTPDRPQWTELPFNSRLILNGIVGINLFKS